VHPKSENYQLYNVDGRTYTFHSSFHTAAIVLSKDASAFGVLELFLLLYLSPSLARWSYALAALNV
jgi:hypothetical protein